jgi:hypothetical protein
MHLCWQRDIALRGKSRRLRRTGTKRLHLLGMPMRFETTVIAVLVMVPVVLTQTPAGAYVLPCDYTRWCAEYAPSAGSTNCGSFTIEQCRATVSGIGGFCEPNQFYNPCGRAGSRRSSRYRYNY